MPVFDIVVVGSGGGLDETNLSGYLVKPYDTSWDDGIIALEAGSGHGALRHIMTRHPDMFGDPAAEDPSNRRTAATIYANVQCFLLTHAHLDHISSLVMAAGTLGGDQKRIYGTPQTLKDLETVFSDRLWPRLASYDETDPCCRLIYHPLHPDGKYAPIFPNVAVRTMPLSHGKNASGPYDSACFFVQHVPTQHEFLFFGDVEPDSVATHPRNAAVWRAAAPKIPHALSVVFIECSYPVGRPDEALWGHLCPEHLVRELVALASEVVRVRTAVRAEHRPRRETRSATRSRTSGLSASGSGSSSASSSSARPRKKQKREPPVLPPEALHGALAGLRVYVMHCKEQFLQSDRPINHVIGDQCRALLAPHKLGVELLTADQGMQIVI